MDWWWFLLVAVRGLSPAADDQWATRLADLDRVRAEAFATANPDLLGDVYQRGSPARRADRHVIEAYARRDGRVVGARLRVLSCRVVSSSADRVRLDVVDQLGPSRVTWGDGTSTSLPRDLPSRRHVTLVRTDDGWRIAGTRPVSPHR